MATLLEQFKGLTKYWWAVLILGIAVLGLGVWILMRPAEGFVSLAVIFAIVMLVSGILQLVIAFTENYLPGRGWIAVGGAIELILGILLVVYPGLSMATLPYFVAFWLLLRGFNLIGLASDMRTLKISGMGWTIALAILLIICAFIILFNPLFGAVAVVVWIGIALIVAGVSIVAFSIDLYGIKKRVRKVMK